MVAEELGHLGRGALEHPAHCCDAVVVVQGAADEGAAHLAGCAEDLLRGGAQAVRRVLGRSRGYKDHFHLSWAIHSWLCASTPVELSKAGGKGIRPRGAASILKRSLAGAISTWAMMKDMTLTTHTRG